MERLDDALTERIGDHKVVSITGSGGKTSLLCLLATHYQEKGESVLVTTTTKLSHPDHFHYPVERVALNEGEACLPIPGKAVLFARPYDAGKICAPRMKELVSLIPSFDRTIVEADGARGYPLKKHTSRDPVILPQSFVVAIAGLTGMGRERERTCFGEEGKGIVDVAYLQYLLDDSQGIAKGISHGRGLILLNQYEMLDEGQRKVITSLRCPYPILCVSIRKNEIYQTIV